MGQGSRKKQAEARQRYFHEQAKRGGQAPPAAPVQPDPVMETQPGHVGSIPTPQIQPHQVARRSGLPGQQPGVEQPAYAPVSGTQIPVTGQGLPHQTQVIQPRQTITPAPQGDVTVILYSSGGSPVLLAAQLAAIQRQTLQPKKLLVHADGKTGHDERTLAKLDPCRTPKIGRHLRFSLARGVDTRYVLLLEEDAMPGAHWLQRAIEAISAADSEELPFGPAVIACSGILQGSDDPGNAHRVGPELPRGEQPLEVDFGRQGWLFARSFARVADSMLRVGASSDSLGILLAAAAQQAGVPTVVLDYGTEKSNWGSIQPHEHGTDPHDAAVAFGAYLEMGWDPPYTGKELAPIQATPQAPAQPTLPTAAHPGDVTERSVGFGISTREFIVPPEQRTPDPNKGRERVLDVHEQTPPPVSSGTEQVVEPSPPPESAKTERILQPSPPPESETGQ